MYENIKERLKEYNKIVAQKNEIQLKIRELEENVGISAMAQGEAISKTYKITSQTENEAIELAAKKADLKKLISSYQLDIDRIDNALNSLYYLDKQAIEILYVQRRSVESACYMMNRSRKIIFKYANRGLKEMNDLFNLAS
ncbi:MAG: RNA polymerase subunit sigma-24 [Bacillota bacterium]|nr:RNA polymerase subunit sigma-24 [Bacillota bacterium]